MEFMIFECERGYGMSDYYLKHPEEIPGYKILVKVG